MNELNDNNSTIAFKAKAKVNSVGIGRERRGEDEYTSTIRMSLEATVVGDILPKLLGTLEAPDWWVQPDAEDADPIPAFRYLEKMKSSAVFENVNATIGKRKVNAARMHSITFKLEAGRVIDLAFTLTLVGLTDAGAGYLCGLFHDEIAVEIESAQVDAFGGES